MLRRVGSERRDSSRAPGGQQRAQHVQFGVDLGAQRTFERSAHGVEVFALGETEWCFAALLCAGGTFADAIEAAPDGDIALFLARHIAAGRFTGFCVSDPSSLETNP